MLESTIVSVKLGDTDWKAQLLVERLSSGNNSGYISGNSLETTIVSLKLGGRC